MGILDALQMLGSMGGGDQMVGQAIPNMEMMARASGLPHINPTQYAQGYEIRRSLRQGLNPAHMSTRGGMTHGGVGAPMPYGMGGGMDPSSMQDPGPANQALAPFGLQMPTHINPFLFFQDQNAQGEPTWAGQHPKVAKAIEGAMVGATTSGEGTTTGDSISNIARTVLSLPGLYKNSAAAQMQAPFDMAHQIAGARMDQAEIQLKLDQAFHAHATGQAMLDKPDPAKPKQLYVGPQGEPYSFDTGTGALSPAVGGPSSVTKPGVPTKSGAPGAAALPKWVGTSAAKQNAYFEYKAQGGEFNQDTTPADQKTWSRLVQKHTSILAGASAGAGAGARKTVGAQYGDLSDTQKAELRPLERDITSAEQELKQVDKLKSSALIQKYNVDDPAKAREMERTAVQTKLDSARRAHQDKLDSYRKPSYDAQGNRK